MKDQTKSNAEKLFNLFRGRQDAHGEFIVGGLNPNKQKLEAKSVKTKIRTKVTVKLWVNHLTTNTGLGIIPIDTSSNCAWGAIDIDDYEVDHKKLLSDIAKFNLPLHVAKSKSGGAHLYLFVDIPVTAYLMRVYLKRCVATLGLASQTEIFPKQEKIDPESDNVGNWINMPYQNGTRPFLDAMGEELTVEQFLDSVNPIDYRQVTSAIKQRKGDTTASEDTGADENGLALLPCMKNCLAFNDGKIPSGYRNAFAFHTGVYLRKRYPSTWTEKLALFNKDYMDKPLPVKETDLIIRQLSHEKYHDAYKCNDPLIEQWCDKEACKLCKGGPSVASMIEWGALTVVRHEEPIFYWEVNGVTIELDLDEVISGKSIRRAIMAKTIRAIPIPKDEDVVKIFNRCAQKAQHIQVEKSLSREAVLLDYLRKFCKLGSSNSEARKREAVLNNLVYFDPVEDYYVFQLKDFLVFLKDYNLKEYDKKMILGIFKSTWQRDDKFQEVHKLKLRRFAVKESRPSCWFIKFPSEASIYDNEDNDNE